MHEFCEQLSAALRREDGQGATEYGLVIAVILLSLALTVVGAAGIVLIGQ
jgi:Flp pilus assembly pilin Flp